MINRKKLIVGVSLVFTTFLLAVFILKPQAQNRNQQQDDPPTPIQLGVMTDKQRKHSRLYEDPSKEIRNRLIRGLKKSPQGFRVISPGDEYLGIDPQRLPPQTEFIKRIVCNADVVLIGTVRDKSSQITEDLNTVFTDYEITINSVIVSKSKLNVNLPASITATSLGGSILINNSRIDYKPKYQKQLKVGTTYLLFLNYLPQSDSYKIIDREGSFSINGDKISRYSDLTSPFRDIIEDTNLFINVIRGSANQCSLQGAN